MSKTTGSGVYVCYRLHISLWDALKMLVGRFLRRRRA